MDTTRTNPSSRDVVLAKYHVHRVHLGATAIPAVWFACLGSFLVYAGISADAVMLKLGALAVGFLFLAVVFGLVRGAEWSRIVGGGACLLNGILGSVFARMSVADVRYLMMGVSVGLIAFGVYLLLPSTKVDFRSAREARVRVSQEAP